MLKYVNVDRTESNSTSSCPGEERKHNRGTSFHFFESFDNQKQPETAQKDDLRLRDVNPDINESKSSSNCEGKSVKSGREVGWTSGDRFFRGCACYLPLSQADISETSDSCYALALF